MNSNPWTLALALGGWLMVGTKIPLLVCSVVLLNVFPQNTIAENLLREEGSCGMMGYVQLERIIHSKVKRKEIVSVTDDVLLNRTVWIVESRDGSNKIVFVPKTATDLEDTFEGTSTELFAADANAPFRWSQGMLIAGLLENPARLLSPWWW